MISIDDLASEITLAVKEYTQDVTEGIEKEVNKRSLSLTKEIKAKSPRSKGKNSGKYAEGWTRRKEVNGGHVSYRTYNKTRGSLVHLLEKGHAKRGGGRVPGKPHVGPAEDRETALLVNNIKSIIRNGG
ncbi:hypothetical protein D3C77_351330 [compost metagenome]